MVTQEAPGTLEHVRDLLNTWGIPNDTRRPADRFDDFAGRAGLTRQQAGELRALRDDLRAAVERQPGGADLVNAWIARVDARPSLGGDGALAYTRNPGPVGDVVAAVLDAVAAGRWPRLKACPDCRWVFYDHTRNGSKRWCVMYAGGPEGRACGTIAKVRAHRARRAAG